MVAWLIDPNTKTMIEAYYTIVFLMMLYPARFEWHEWKGYLLLYLIGLLSIAGIRYYLGV
jgi:hypothetical protein